MPGELVRSEGGGLTQEHTRDTSYQASGNGKIKPYSTYDRRSIAQAKLSSAHSLEERLLEQLSFLQLNERQRKIGMHHFGSMENDGYLRRDLESIVNDVAFTQHLSIDVQ